METIHFPLYLHLSAHSGSSHVTKALPSDGQEIGIALSPPIWSLLDCLPAEGAELECWKPP